MEEVQKEIKLDIINDVKNLNEYQNRAMKMKRNLEMAYELSEQSLEQYRKGEISLQSLLQMLDGQEDSSRNFLRMYLRYRMTLLSLMMDTYYDYEKNQPLLKQFNLGKASNLKI